MAAATGRELAWALPDAGEVPRGPALLAAELCGLKVALIVTGVGPVRAALTLGQALLEVRAPLLLSVGVGGAFAQSGLNLGDLALATDEVDVDTGVEPSSPSDPLLPLEVPGFDLAPTVLQTDDGSRLALFKAARDVAPVIGGRFVTSATVTGTEARAARLAELYNPVCESMEGYAAALAADANRMRFAEVRGISNVVGPRSRSGWSIDEAISAAGMCVTRFLEGM